MFMVGFVLIVTVGQFAVMAAVGTCMYGGLAKWWRMTAEEQREFHARRRAR